MEVDIHQLPIPDWNLACPGCGYLLNGLPSHQCPECGLELDMVEITPSWARLREPLYTGCESPLPDFGLRCAACDELLAGAVDSECPNCGRPFDVPGLRPHKAWFVADPNTYRPVPLQLVESVLASHFVPFHMREGRSAFGVSWWDLMVPGEFYFDYLYLVRQTAERMAQGAAVIDDADWDCPACGQANPADFDLCWSCELPRQA